jgi:hypothetical protein
MIVIWGWEQELLLPTNFNCMEHQQQQKYTCPMHPEIIQDVPGNCPKCGMSLVPVKAELSKSGSHPHSNNNPLVNHAAHSNHCFPEFFQFF